jgi:hypothetical protein
VDNAKDFQEHYHIAKFNDAFGLTQALNPVVEFEKRNSMAEEPENHQSEQHKKQGN